MTKQEILNSGVFTDTTVASNETLTAEQLLLHVTDTSMCGYFAHNNIKESVKPLVKEIEEAPVEPVTIEEAPVVKEETPAVEETPVVEEVVEPVVVKEEKPKKSNKKATKEVVEEKPIVDPEE